MKPTMYIERRKFDMGSNIVHDCQFKFGIEFETKDNLMNSFHNKVMAQGKSQYSSKCKIMLQQLVHYKFEQANQMLFYIFFLRHGLPLHLAGRTFDWVETWLRYCCNRLSTRRTNLLAWFDCRSS